MFFIPSKTARINLNKEGISKNIFNVGDVMFDMVKLAFDKGYLKNNSLDPFYYITLHRPYNVDEKERLEVLLDVINSLDKKAVFSIHPRTKNKMKQFNMSFENYKNIEFIDPVSYFENINYIYNSAGLITDSGGMQKEAYWLKKKCITMRPETEWVETLENGWNTLVFDNPNELLEFIGQKPGFHMDEAYGDGNASDNIRKEILNYFKSRN
jgi:UDP-N-acetylglucosamine 2-epimerase